MRRITKKVHSKRHTSPLLSILPWLILATIVQGIINIFSELHFSIIWNDLLFLSFFLFVFSIIFYYDQPVNAFPNRKDIWKIFSWVLLGNTFIYVQIENGNISSDLPITDQRKVIGVDPNSAVAILQPDHNLIIHSAGFYCLEKNQTVLAVFDLRAQSTPIPQNASNEMLTTNSAEAVTPDRSALSPLTATTKDGYQVGAVFWITYKYDCDFGYGENPFGFDAAILQKALGKNPTGSPISINPQELALEVLQQVFQNMWQNNIAEYDLLEIIPQTATQPSALEDIENRFKQELTHQEISRPLSQPLRENGLRVLNLTLVQFWLSEETNIAIQHHWQPNARQVISSMQQEQQQKTHLYRELGEMHAVYSYLKQNGRIV
ncbi:MAG TPA: hypothetical protein DCK95_07240 [Anaerolineaceae bacterium]|uniref:Band 7 domain-containing protein n=1 Tax=Anaerolinea thermophila TaxID=167964 RepID=A0A101FXZ8_9CHLR|nr:MAG: hypothetical protein XD73_0583 [Anaerolinea thermophila]HAF62102.1 hypothetical protein [Anaerolineaceae bacterium]